MQLKVIAGFRLKLFHIYAFRVSCIMSLTEGERERLNTLARGNVTFLDAEAREVFDELVDDAILGLAFEVHRYFETGNYIRGTFLFLP